MNQVDDFWVFMQKTSKSIHHKDTSLFLLFDALFQYPAYISINILLDKENMLINTMNFFQSQRTNEMTLEENGWNWKSLW